jgi:ABC-2 type transport system permease protein
MRAFFRVLAFELAYLARRPSTHVYFGTFFALSALLMLSMGAGINSYLVRGSGDGWLAWANAPLTVGWVLALFSMFGVIVTAALLGRAVQRDFAHGMHPFFFSQPISRHAYLGGRFAGGLLANAYVLAGVPLGLLFTSLLPVMQPDRLGPFRLAAFAQPYLVVMLPTMVFTTAVFFVLAAHTRRMLPNYVGGVLMLVGYLIGSGMLTNVESLVLVSILDPFALNTLEVATRYWTVAEQNTLLLPVSGLLLLNRVSWLVLGAAVLAVGWWRFRLVEVTEGRRRRRRAAASPPDLSAATPVRPLPTVSRSFDRAARLRQYLSLTQVAFLGIVRDVYFYALTGAGLLVVLSFASNAGRQFGTPVQPTTYRVLEALGGPYGLFVIIVAAFYAGELVWRERDLRAQQVVDAMPIPTGLALSAKLTALGGALAVMLTLLIPLGMGIQVWHGYYRFQPGLYLGTLFGMRLPEYLLFAGLALGVHAILNHKHLAHLVVIVGMVLTLSLGDFGMEHVLYRFGSDAGEVYSAMLGYGSFLAPFLWLKAYWAGWVGLLLLAALLGWGRGEETSLRLRLDAARQRASRRHGLAALGSLLLVAGTGGFVYANTNVLNTYEPSRAQQRRDADYEREYRHLRDVPQPRIAATTLDVDLYPGERRAEIRASHRLVNRSGTAIDTLHLSFHPRLEVRELEVSGARLERVDSRQGQRVLVFHRPLEHGDSAVLTYALTLRQRGFRHVEGTFPVRENGTFITGTSLQPAIGYEFARELAPPDARRRNRLPPREGLPDRQAPGVSALPLFNTGTDGQLFSATVTTAADQIGVAPGELVEHVRTNGRAVFRYEARRPIQFYGVASGRWTERRDRWGGIDIVVYHHSTHGQNVDRMIQSAREALEYCTTRFGPYPFSRVAILELPRTGQGGGAQAQPGMVPYSEDAGFSARIREGDVDVPFYVTAHEVAHYWWGHQLVPARAQGGQVLSETLAQYTALMVMKHHYGREHIRRFLRYELDRYLVGRAQEGRSETPLAVSERGYVHYRKGSLAMFALQDVIGEERVNQALRALLEEAADVAPAYLTTLDLLRHLRAVTPDSVAPLLEDLFDRIVLFDNQIKSAEATPRPHGGYQVRLAVQARKLIADSTGQELEAPMNDLVEVVVFGERPRRGQDPPVLYSRKHRLASGETVLEVDVDATPARAGIDPFHVLVDRTPRDNERAVTVRAP